MNYKVNPKISHSPDESYVESLFRARGFSHEQMLKYLKPDVSMLYPPLLLDRINEGAELLMKHLKDGSKIYLVVDCD